VRTSFQCGPEGKATGTLSISLCGSQDPPSDMASALPCHDLSCASPSSEVHRAVATHSHLHCLPVQTLSLQVVPPRHSFPHSPAANCRYSFTQSLAANLQVICWSFTPGAVLLCSLILIMKGIDTMQMHEGTCHNPNLREGPHIASYFCSRRHLHRK
jgi:hypothetical protein